jgi:acyl-coenzyme A thioesterase PaaI-like protein
LPSVPLSHHDLCFGCGLANVFGLQIELERRPDGSVEGRFFVKQDHQGPPGVAHGGILAAALDEAAGLAAGDGLEAPRMARLEVDFLAPAPLGAFVRLRAHVESEEGRRVSVEARAFGAEENAPELARARALLIRPAQR